MGSARQQPAVKVDVSQDKSEARLTIAAELAEDPTAQALCQQALTEHHVAWTESVAEAVGELLAAGAAPEQTRSAVVARAIPPRHGVDGYVQWQAEESDDPSSSNADGNTPAETDPQRVDFYRHSAYVMVEHGQVIGTMVEPTPGEDGQDVTGGVLAAKSGQPAAIRLDDSIMQDATGQLIAQREGVLIRRAGKATISPVLEIAHYVDFSTGHIDFDGDVVVNQGVRDRFEVKATGRVEIHGLIEAAIIECGGDLVAHTGMAARGNGHATVGGDLVVGYLDNVDVEVHGVLHLHREAINCHLTAYGGVDADAASIIGGKAFLVGDARVGTLGSSAGIGTTVVLGRVPHLEEQQSQLNLLLQQLAVKQKRLSEEQAQFTQRKASSAQDRERQTELMFELQQIEQRTARAHAAQAVVAQRIKQCQTANLHIVKHIYPGVIIVACDMGHRVNHPIVGPLNIVTENGQTICQRHGSDHHPLTDIAPLIND